MKSFQKITSLYSGLQVIAIALIVFVVLKNYMIKSLDDATWLLAFLVAFLISDFYEKINLYSELAKEKEDLEKRLQKIESRIDW